MNIQLNVLLLVLSTAILSKATEEDWKPSENYLEGMFRYLAKEKCTSICKEKLSSCKEFRSQMSVCENLNIPIYQKNYAAAMSTCNDSDPPESLLVCTYDSIRSTYKLEGLSLPENFLNEFVDSLTKTDEV